MLGFIVSGGATATLGYLSTNVPTDPKALGHFHFVILVVCVVGFIALATIGVIDYLQEKERNKLEKDRDERDRQRDKRDEEWERRADERERLSAERFAELSERLAKAGESREEPPAPPAPPPPPKVPTTLRQAGLEMAKRMRDFANETDCTDGSDKLLMEFWKSFPFRSYDAIKERMIVPLGRWNVKPASDWLPNRHAVILDLANSIESDALKVPPDVLL